MKILIIITIISIFLGTIIAFITVISRAWKKVKRDLYPEYQKMVQKFLLEMMQEIIQTKSEPDRNHARVSIRYKKRILNDKIILMFSARPGIDTDGEIFIIIGKYTQSINKNEKMINITISEPLLIIDSKENIIYYKYSDSNFKRIRKIVKAINMGLELEIKWTANPIENQARVRHEFLKQIKEDYHEV